MIRKKYVRVTADFDPCGGIRPLAVIWEDGTRYEVDRVLDVRPSASLKAGGYGIRYTCRILGREAYLFLERDRWFVEAKGDAAASEG